MQPLGRTVLVDVYLLTSGPRGQGTELASAFLLSLSPPSACAASEALAAARSV